MLHSVKTVLVVEDDHDILSSLAEVIREEGFDVLTAANGYQALAEVEAHMPDLIFLDLMMPIMNGWKFLEELRRRFPTHHPPIVLLSAVTGLEETAVNLGVNYFLKKPFELKDVMRITREQLDRESLHVA